MLNDIETAPAQPAQAGHQVPSNDLTNHDSSSNPDEAAHTCSVADWPVATSPMDSSHKKRSRQAYLEMPMSIFIHAGAGYHSLQNESVHLAICSKLVCLS